MADSDIQRLVVVSDLHVGLDGDYNIFAGKEEFGAFTARLGAGDHLVLNGDAFDFLLDADPMEMDRAVARAQAILSGTEGLVVAAGLAGVLNRGGAVTVRCGNHDPETGRDEVQQLLRGAIGKGLEVDRGDVTQYEVGGVRVAVAHGEADDTWNTYDHDAIEQPEFKYPPGSKLVKSLLNPAKDEGLAFVDLLKPDVEGALLAVLAVRPSMAQRLASTETASILWQLGKRMRGSPLAAVRGMTQEGAVARLDPEAADALAQILDDAIDPPTRGAVGSRFRKPLKERVRAAWLRAGLFFWSRVQRGVAGTAGDDYFELAPTDDEWQHALALSAGHDADVVLLGHTHAARFQSFGGLVYANTGTWIPLMRLPPSDAPIEAWEALLRDLDADPRLVGDAARTRLIERLTFVEVDARGPDRSVGLMQWTGAEAKVLASDAVRARATRGGLPSRSVHSGTMRGGMRALVEPDAAESETSGTPLQPRIDRLARELDAWAARNPAITWEVLTPKAHMLALIEQARMLLDRARSSTVENGLELLADAETAWSLYRHADAQRRDPELGARLQIADAIAFDGYRLVMSRARAAGVVGGDETRVPVPLVFIEPGLSPVTAPRGNRLRGPSVSPGPTRRTITPFPVVLLPPDHLATPWWLTVLLHEVGHDLDADLGLETVLPAAVEEALSASPRCDAWLRWLPEILADISGARLAGPEFAVSLHELATLVGATSWYTTGEHPPLALRMELVARLLGESSPERVWSQVEAPYRDEVDAVLTAIRRARKGSLTIDELFAAAPLEQTWRGLPGAIQRRVSGGLAVADANAEFDRGADALAPMSWQVGPDYRRFLREQVPRLAPTILEPDSTYKIPPLALLTTFDEAWFVGVTNGQLADRIEQAFAERGRRKWDRLVFFFLDDAGIDRIAESDEEAERLRKERDLAFRDLTEASKKHVEHEPALGMVNDTFFFASYWRRKGERRVHVTTKIPGQDIRTCPAVDYRAVDGQTNPSLTAHFRGLAKLCARENLPEHTP